MYSAKVLDHFHNPRNVGEIEEASLVVEATNPVCGDVMKMWAIIQDGRIVKVKFKTAGCVPAVACGSWLTEWISGQRLDELAPPSPEQIAAALDGLSPASQHAAALASDIFRKFIARAR